MAHRKLSVLLYFLAATALSVGQSPHPEVTLEQVKTALQNAPATHPSLLVNDRQFQTILANIESDPFFKAISEAIIKDADTFVGRKPVERVMTGRRLLSVSRDCVNRLVCLGMAYRLTGDAKYVKQAETEMLAAAAFADWNPSHFLDTAEMTGAMGIGYDWFYAALSEESKSIIRKAILEKGIHQSQTENLVSNLKNNWWLASGNNWNQVCNGGITLGALAVRNEEPELAAQIVHRAVVTVKLPMDEYEPDGAYPEGPSYWSYGTTYNVALIAGLDSVLGTDFGLSQRNGFAQSADYYLHTTGPSGWYFNYADCGRSGGVNPAVFWFAQHYQKPHLLYHQLQMLWPKGSTQVRTSSTWFFPLLLLWGQAKAEVPQQLHWMGQGTTPVAVFRSSWTDANAAYLAIKAGTASSNHAHIDAGSFIYEADGIRWAQDLGMQNYTKMESRGLNIWNSSQNSDRWKIFRYSNFAHNTLTVNGQLHNVRGVSKLVQFSDEVSRPHAVIELDGVFKDQLAKARRGATLLPDRRALIQDECKAGDETASVRWAMVAPGKIEILSPTMAKLTEKGKTLFVEVYCPKATQMKIYPTDPPAEWDEPNPNTSIIGFELALEPQEEIRLAVVLTPGSITEKPDTPRIMPMTDWSKPLK
jgi:hypothetical protein